MLIDILNTESLGEVMTSTPVKVLFVGNYLDGSLQIAQSKIDNTHIMFAFESMDIQFSGNTTVTTDTGNISKAEIDILLTMIATEYYNRCMYIKESIIKNGEYIH